MVNAAGSGGRLEPVQVPLSVGACSEPATRAAAGADAPAVPALGLAGDAGNRGEAPSPDVKALEAAINQL